MTAIRSRLFPRAGRIALLAVLVGACSSPERRAADASERAVAATATGDLPSARNAWLEATRARDDVADYWSALGRVQLALGNFPGAYEAYSRAVELNRSDPVALQALAELSLPLNRGREAEELGRQLELLAPGTVAPPTVRGFAALHRSDYRAALGYADAIFALAPSDLGATIMKGRALIGLEQPAQGIGLLERYVTLHPDSEQTLRSLEAIYAATEDDRNLARIRRQLLALAPTDVTRSIDLATSLYASGANVEGRAITTRLAGGELSAGNLLTVLRLWLRYEDRARALDDFAALPAPADTSGALNRARFLIEAGEPAAALPFLDGRAVLPVAAGNADANAVLAHALDALARRREASQRVDAVLAFDPSNIVALRARTDLLLRTARADLALVDAQRLVLENPNAPEDRLRLANAYTALGNRHAAENAYWDAFRDLDGEPTIYRLFRRRLLADGLDVTSLDTHYRIFRQRIIDRF